MSGTAEKILELPALLIGSILVFSACVVARDWQCLSLLTIWALGCTIRLRHGDRHLATDCWILGAILSWSKRDELMIGVVRQWNNLFQSGALVGSKTLLGASFTVLLALGVSISHSMHAESARKSDLPPTARKWTSEYPKARIFPCQTTHARMFPKKHAFSYSYLQCGYPIIPQGITASGMHVSTGQDGTLGSWWLRVKAEDYLDRGNGDLGFYGKLKMYLREHEVGDADWAYAYLVTAPRFFGYAFNPVSFWYVYDERHQLKKMILEVNNTFDERRMYLLDGSSPPSPPRTAGSDASGELESDVPAVVQVAKTRFTDVWMKDFHVSPFNSRKGSYALKALDLFPNGTYEDPRIDNTITLKSSKDYGKLVARLYSTDKAIDLETMGLAGTLRFVLSWWWVGLLTFPRIARQAFKLFFTRKLHVWYRPEVLTSSIGRLPTPSELTLHKVFQAYLQQLVHQTSEIFCITFKPGLPNIPPQIITTTRQPTPDHPIRNLELRVLTPSFYSRLVHYAYTSEAIDRECVFSEEKNRTLWLCRPNLLSLLLSAKSSLHVGPGKLRHQSYLDALRWHLLRKLRCAPPAAAAASTLSSSVVDIRARPASELDRFVQSEHGSAYAGEYRRVVTEIFLAQRFALGFVEVIEAMDLLVRAMLVWWGVGQLDMLGGCVTSFVEFQGMVEGNGWVVGRVVAAVLSCHVYQVCKGYR